MVRALLYFLKSRESILRGLHFVTVMLEPRPQDSENSDLIIDTEKVKTLARQHGRRVKRYTCTSRKGRRSMSPHYGAKVPHWFVRSRRSPTKAERNRPPKRIIWVRSSNWTASAKLLLRWQRGHVSGGADARRSVALRGDSGGR